MSRHKNKLSQPLWEPVTSFAALALCVLYCHLVAVLAHCNTRTFPFMPLNGTRILGKFI